MWYDWNSILSFVSVSSAYSREEDVQCFARDDDPHCSWRNCQTGRWHFRMQSHLSTSGAFNAIVDDSKQYSAEFSVKFITITIYPGCLLETYSERQSLTYLWATKCIEVNKGCSGIYMYHYLSLKLRKNLLLLKDSCVWFSDWVYSCHSSSRTNETDWRLLYRRTGVHGFVINSYLTISTVILLTAMHDLYAVLLILYWLFRVLVYAKSLIDMLAYI